MMLEERTPLMIASMFGSKQVLNFILTQNCVDVNKICGSDRATALHLAVSGGSNSCIEVVKLLIDASADTNCLDVNGNRPVDLIPFVFGSCFNSKRKLLEFMLNGYNYSDNEELRLLSELIDNHIEEEQKVSPISVKKEYRIDPSLPDMKNGIYNTDEFRMYTFKIKPCLRAYSHDWTECPFVHPGENARRRDTRKYHYSCVPCPEFRKGSCRHGDNCEYAHGIFECWLHPAQYRTRLCKDEIGCNRKVCFFAHKLEELRPLHPSTGSAILSPRSLSDVLSVNPFSVGSPPTPWSNQSSPTVKPVNHRFRGAPSGQDSDRYFQQVPFSSDYFQNMNYSPGLPSSPLGIMNSRADAFAKRSQSFIDRGTVNRQSTMVPPSNLSDWSSPDGKLNWGIEKEEINKLKKSVSFGVRSSGTSYGLSTNNNVAFDDEQNFSPWLEEQLVN